MVIKNNYERNFEIHYNMLRYSGVWPIPNASFWYKFKGWSLFSCVFLLVVTMFIEAIKDMHDVSKLSEVLYTMMTIATYLIKHLVFFYRRGTFLRMLDLLKDPILSSYPDDLDAFMTKRVKISRYATNFYRYWVLICLTLMAMPPLFDRNALPFPFSFEIGNYKYFMWFFQILGSSIISWNNVSLDSLAASLIGLGATHLEILCKKITRVGYKNYKIVDETSTTYKKHLRTEKEVADSLKQCVRHHLAIIKYIECINKIFSLSVLAQFFASVIIICNTLFQFVLVRIDSVQFFVLVTYFGFLITQLYMYCWFGDEVIWMSLALRDACYSLNWCDYGEEVRKYLFIIMERSKKPLKLTVYKLSVLSLQSFTNILQWSYSYFTLIMNLYSKQRKTI